jgi:hypothetical protein
MQEKSSKIFENSKEGTIGARIKVLLSETNKNVTELEEAGGIGNGTLKSWKEKSIDFSSNVVTGFKRTLMINDSWWSTGKGEIFNKKSTYVEIPTDNKEKMENQDDFLHTFKGLVEGNTEYLLVPRGVLKDNYRLISLEQYQKDQAQLEKEKQQIAKDLEQIQIYKEELKNKNKHIEILLLTNKGLYEQLNSVHALKSQLLPPEKSQQNP